MSHYPPYSFGLHHLFRTRVRHTPSSSAHGGGSGGSSGGGKKGGPGPPGKDGATGATGNQQPPGAGWTTPIFGLPIVVPGGGIAVPRVVTGPYNIQEVIVLTQGGPGSCRIKVWKANLSSHYPPVVGDDITGGNDITLTAQSSYDDTVLSGWTVPLIQDDVLLFTLASSSNFTYVQVQLRLG